MPSLDKTFARSAPLPPLLLVSFFPFFITNFSDQKKGYIRLLRDLHRGLRPPHFGRLFKIFTECPHCGVWRDGAKRDPIFTTTAPPLQYAASVDTPNLQFNI